MNLISVAEEIQHRIIHIFSRDVEGRRATNGGNPRLDYDPHYRDYVWFYEVGNIIDVLVHGGSLSCFLSFSMLITVADLALHTKLGGKMQLGRFPDGSQTCLSLLLKVWLGCISYPSERGELPLAQDA